MFRDRNLHSVLSDLYRSAKKGINMNKHERYVIDCAEEYAKSVSCYAPVSDEESQLRRAIKDLREHRLSVLRKKRKQKRGKK